MNVNDFIFHAVTGRAPTTEERLRSLNRNRTGPGRFVDPRDPEVAAELESRKEAQRRKTAASTAETEQFKMYAQPRSLWGDKEKATALRKRLAWDFESINVSDRHGSRRCADFLRWLCRVATTSHGTYSAEWVRAAYRDPAWRNQFERGMAIPGYWNKDNTRRPFDLAPDQSWEQVERDYRAEKGY